MEAPKSTIAKRLREAMDSAGKRQADLVHETGLDRGSISSYLSGKYEPKQKAIYKLARALNVNEAWLLGYDVPMDRTDDQKKSDQMVQLVDRLKTDSKFHKIVSTIATLNEKQYQSIEMLVATFAEGVGE